MRGGLSRVAVTSLCCLALLGGAGCFGKSVVTTSVVKWHSDIDADKYVKEGIYLPIFFFVLPITALVDNFILNAIDFWSKDDPLASAPSPEAAPPPGQDQKPELASEGAAAPAVPSLVLD